MITIFTPTYNRAYILPKLYESLVAQTCKDFEWVIVNDGSTDKTEDLLICWKQENKINISSINRENGGKSSAINEGLKIARGDLFFIVDSDDYLTSDAIEIILTDYNFFKNNKITFSVAGLCYRKCNYRTGSIITSSDIALPEYASSLELAFVYKQQGDKAEVFFTNVLRQFPFPEIEGNKFIPEALIWYRIAAQDFKLIIKEKAIYQCDYIADGYTKNFKKNLKSNYKGFYLFYKECLSYKIIPTHIKIKYLIRMIQCIIYSLSR